MRTILSWRNVSGRSLFRRKIPNGWFHAATVLACALWTSTVANGTEQTAPPPLRSPSCILARQSAGIVVEVIDAVTVRLSDGQVVRLAGLVPPDAPIASSITPADWPPASSAKSALAALVADSAAIEIAVANPKARIDRYGRTVAHLISTRDGQPVWVQGSLLRSGHARVSAVGSGALCVDAMLALEADARDEPRGVWANAAYRAVDADDTLALKRQRALFVVVEGTVISVAQRSSRTYLNFGLQWSWDFTAAVPKSVLNDATPEAIAKLGALKGRRVRVRGWIEQRNGPMIEVADLAEIEDLTSQK
jgi:micrococcal nuclease